MVPSSTPVVIIGGGPVGLVCSALLSLQGIDHVVFERQPDTSIHPKAVGLNQRTIEIFRKIGVEHEVLRQAAPPSMSGRTAWYTSFGPNGREICARYAWGGGPYQEAFEKASPCGYALLPQIRLEPILKQRALQLNANIFYNHEVDAVEDKEDHVLVRFHERGKAGNATISATYALGCDGGRALASQLGISMNGESDIVDMVTAHIRSPLSKHRPDPSVFLHWFISPELGGSLKTGYLYHIGPYPMHPETEEWVFGCARLPHERSKPFSKPDILQRIQQTLKISELEVDVFSLSHWYVNAIVAEKYRSKSGRVFLVGDAAHRIPPWGALGLNSGIQDADNLVWKLAMTMKHPEQNFGGFLDSYDAERRPIGERVAKTSLYNMRAHALVLDEAMGLSPNKSETDNMRAMDQYFDSSDRDQGSAMRQEVDKAMNDLDVEFYAHGAEVGWFYDFEYDGTYGCSKDNEVNPQLKPNGEMELCTYHPTLRPGSQLPHVWFKDKGNGERISTRELIAIDRLVLLGMSDNWRNVKHPLVEVRVVDEHNGDLMDSEGAWKRRCSDFEDSGAVLVRPDIIIAYRFLDDSILQEADFQVKFSGIVEMTLRLGR